MEKNEIKKALYRQKPIAVKTGETFGREFEDDDSFLYETSISLDGISKKIIKFEVPVSDMGDATFEDEISAQLLIRYLKN